MERPTSGFRSLRALAIVACIAIAVCSAAYAVVTCIDAWGRHSFPAWDDMEATPSGAELVAVLGMAGSAVAMLPSLLIGIILFLMWVHRANGNARALGAEGMRFTPGWSVGWFFVPIFNLWRPYQILAEIWQASDPERGPADWKGGDATIVGAWWGLWIVSNLVVQSIERATEEGSMAAVTIAVIDGLLFIVAGIVAILMVRGLTRRQERKAHGAAAESLQAGAQ